MLIPIITEAVKTGDRSHDVDCLLFSGIWDERRSLSLSRTDSRISRIVCSVRHEVWSHTYCHATLLFSLQHKNFSTKARRAQSCRLKTRQPHPMSTNSRYSIVIAQYSTTPMSINSRRRRSLSTTGFHPDLAPALLEELDEINVMEEADLEKPRPKFLSKSHTLNY